MNKNATSTENNQPAPENNDLARYELLMTRRHHGENIFWSRVQTLHAIQAAILAGGYFFHANDNCPASTAVFYLGATLTALLFILIYYDWKDASINDSELKTLGSRLRIKRIAHIWGRKYLRSHRIVYAVTGLFFAIDIFLAIFRKVIWPL